MIAGVSSSVSSLKGVGWGRDLPYQTRAEGIGVGVTVSQVSGIVGFILDFSQLLTGGG